MVGDAKLGQGDKTPYQSEDPSHKNQHIERTKSSHKKTAHRENEEKKKIDQKGASSLGIWTIKKILAQLL